MLPFCKVKLYLDLMLISSIITTHFMHQTQLTSA